MINRFIITLCAIAVAAFPSAARSAESDASLAPVFAASEGWLNGRATAENVRGKVVVVDVFTFGCINCKNVLPELRELARADASDVAIVGVHSPETSYEKNRANVIENLRALAITWPVAIDNSFTIWKSYGVDAWPTQLFFDRHGRLRKTIVGDSQDDAVRATIERLIAEK